MKKDESLLIKNLQKLLKIFFKKTKFKNLIYLNEKSKLEMFLASFETCFFFSSCFFFSLLFSSSRQF